MKKEQIITRSEWQDRYYRFAYMIMVAMICGLLYFLQENGFAWEATLFGRLFLTVLGTVWPLYRFFRTRNKEYLFVAIFVLAAWGLPLLSTLTQGK